MVHIDGSYGEGGGQVLRTSLSLAALLGCELQITDIRAGRPKPGLAAQHVTCVRAAAAICGAEVRGDAVNSGQVVFRPGTIQAGDYLFDVSDVRASAGSVSLVLQTVLPPLLFADGPSQVTLRGGTNVPWSPTFEYLSHVFLPAIRRLGAECTLKRARGGWYPAGGGEIVAGISPLQGHLQPVQLTDRGDLRALDAVTTVSDGLPEHIAKRQLASALQELPTQLSRRARRTTHRPEGGPGTAVLLAGTWESGHAGAGALGERGKPAERVGAEAGEEFRAFIESGAAVDRHLADQLLLYAALAEGTSRYTAQARTLHLDTNAWVIHQFLGDRVSIEGDGPATVSVEGIGLGA
ncbi:MAG: RNA 3'-terminal phosphate cyclase [Armatimonadetes bacterium]|nr:RNA 3'-terminal phosphate cyclase [Armatimonadota bacterium]